MNTRLNGLPAWRLAMLALFGGALLACPSRSDGAVLLATLSSPTAQTLVNAGSDGVIIGNGRFFDFSFTSSGSITHPASSLSVEPLFLSGGTWGLRFAAAWFASGGGSTNDVFSYKVEAVDPLRPIINLSLFSDGTAPVPSSGTFTSSSVTARTSSGATVGRIVRAYDDGDTVPDTTAPDNAVDSLTFAPQTSLRVTQSIFAVSSVSGGSNGVATASVNELTFTNAAAIPEPRMGGWMFAMIVVSFVFSRRHFHRRMVLPVACRY